jgi:hypothetical protein
MIKYEMFVRASSNGGFGRQCINEIFHCRLLNLCEDPYSQSMQDAELKDYVAKSQAAVFYDDFIPTEERNQITSL